MKSLIAIQPAAIGKDAIPTCNARDLHEFLEVQTQFKDWIARRIEEYDFEEGKDFCSILSESTGGRPAKEYALSLDMAKELSMVERTEKGKQARQYFIECERQAKVGGQAKIAKPQDEFTRALKLTPLAVRALRAFGFKGNAATISANQLIRKETQVDLLALSGNTALVAENQTSKPYIPTELGMRMGGLSGKKVSWQRRGCKSNPPKTGYQPIRPKATTSGTTPPAATTTARPSHNSNGTTASCR